VIRDKLSQFDSAAIERFVTEDAYIKKGLATTDTVIFGGKEVGLAGASKPQQ
jgi:hypothetical protein